MKAEPTATERAIRDIVADRLHVIPEEVSLDRALLDDLGMESFEVVDAILEIERRFAPATIVSADEVDLRTIRQLAAYIDAQLGDARSR